MNVYELAFRRIRKVYEKRGLSHLEYCYMRPHILVSFLLETGMTKELAEQTAQRIFREQHKC